jgi:Cdc6-like AAA superfamily ATPase
LNIPKRNNGKQPQTTCKLRKVALETLRKTRDELNYSNYSDLILSLCSKTNGLKPYASVEAIKETDRPIILTGKSGAGKTTFLKSIIKDLDKPILIVDAHNEYIEFPKTIIASQIYSIDFNNNYNEVLRFIPNSEYTRSAELSFLFQGLNQVKHKISNLTILVDEAHLLRNNQYFRDFITEGRKFTKKIILVATDYRLYDFLGTTCTVPDWRNNPGDN